MSRTLRRAVVCALIFTTLPAGIAQAETADEFVARTNRELAELGLELNAAGWTQATYINVDTQLINAKANERFFAYVGKAVEDAKQFEGQPMSAASKRALVLLKFIATPAPDDPAKRAEFSKLLAAMEAKYGSGKYCPQGPESCRDETKLKAVLESSRNYDELLDAWTGWHSTARPLRADYARYVELANDGARGFGFEDLGAMWRSNYDMSAAEFQREAARLYGQVQPLYKELHCYTRNKLQQKYGAEKVPSGKPIPAHLLGNMWAQQWDAIYELLEPYPGVSSLDVDSALEKQSYDAVKMTKSA
ncbi:MAG TPA: M2 family metallopeptidase, partial [Burkholderiales bacterium]|nr:M2 family metallopeptidase [Burkholderiales bacterium]